MVVSSTGACRSSVRSRTLLTCWIVGCILAVSATAQVGKPAPGWALTLGDESHAVVRQSGEVRVWRDEVIVIGDTPYKISIAFADRSAYQQARDLGIDTIDLGSMETTLIRDDRGEVRVLPPAKSSSAFLDLAKSANGALCGDSVVRGFVRLADDLYAGVSLHAGSIVEPARFEALVDHEGNVLETRATQAEATAIDIGDVEVKEVEFASDIFDDCDLFAAGGCGGPDCVTAVRRCGVTTNHPGFCDVLEVWGPDSCWCNWG